MITAAPAPHASTSPKATKAPSLLHADTATITFSAQKDGKLRLRSSSWGDDYKVAQEGEVVEMSCGKQGVECRIVPALRRGEDLITAIQRARDPYDGDEALAARLRHQLLTQHASPPLQPAGPDEYSE